MTAGSSPRHLDARGDTPLATFQPALQNVEIGSLIKAFNYSLNLTGKLSLSGEFSGTRIDADDFRRHWQGQAQLQMADTRTEGLNFQQLGSRPWSAAPTCGRRKITTMPPARIP